MLPTQVLEKSRQYFTVQTQNLQTSSGSSGHGRSMQPLENLSRAFKQKYQTKGRKEGEKKTIHLAFSTMVTRLSDSAVRDL